METQKFYQIVGVILAIIVVGILVAYYLNTREGSTVPDETSTGLADADRQRLLDSLKNSTASLPTAEERQKLLDSLQSAESATPVTDAERQALLESLKTR